MHSIIAFRPLVKAGGLAIYTRETTTASCTHDGRPGFGRGIVFANSLIVLSPGSAVCFVPMDDTILRVKIVVSLRLRRCNEHVVPPGTCKLMHASHLVLLVTGGGWVWWTRSFHSPRPET